MKTGTYFDIIFTSFCWILDSQFVTPRQLVNSSERKKARDYIPKYEKYVDLEMSASMSFR